MDKNTQIAVTTEILARLEKIGIGGSPVEMENYFKELRMHIDFLKAPPPKEVVKPVEKPPFVPPVFHSTPEVAPVFHSAPPTLPKSPTGDFNSNNSL